MHSYILPIAALASAATAKVCTNVTVPVNIDTRQAIFDEDLVGINSNIDATTFSLNFTEQGVNFTDVALTGYQTLQIPANISAKFCRPDNMNDTHNPTVQVLTHGIGFDKTYWDLPYDVSTPKGRDMLSRTQLTWFFTGLQILVRRCRRRPVRVLHRRHRPLRHQQLHPRRPLQRGAGTC